MGIPTLIKTLTASGDSSLSFVDGTASVVFDNTYDEYMFVCTDIGPATDDVHLQFQVNKVDDSGFDKTVTTATWVAHLNEGNSDPSLGYQTAHDQADGTAYQSLAVGIGNGSDESAAGILHIFAPSSTTYVTNFYSRFHHQTEHDYAFDFFVAGYFNITEAIDEISFKMSSGNFDGVIQMYGIS